MNFFLPGFFDSIGRVPQHCLPEFEGGTVDHDAAFLSTALLALLILVTIVKACIWVVCTLYSWFKFPFSDFQWIDDEEDGDLAPGEAASNVGSADKQRLRQIADSLEERIWDVRHEDECVICLNDFQPNDVVVSQRDRRRSCRHVFHKECLHQWLQVKSSCPCCRQKLVVTSACRKKQEPEPEEYRMPQWTTRNDEEQIAVSLNTPWTTPEARPSYVQFEDVWGFCLFLF